MNILLLNDTSDYHNGCKAVISTYSFNASVKTLESVDTIDFRKYTHVVLNGEGTLHHNKPNAIKFIKAIEKAQYYGCHTYVYNTVWQAMNQQYADILKKCKQVIAREILSQQALALQGVSAKVEPDRSLTVPVATQFFTHQIIYEGQYFYEYEPINKFPRINIFEESWDTVVNKLRNADLLITNRHHEAYAAIKANCKFIALPSNSHKIEGIFLSAGVDPITSYYQIRDVLAGKYDAQYAKLFEHYNKFSRTTSFW